MDYNHTAFEVKLGHLVEEYQNSMTLDLQYAHDMQRSKFLWELRAFFNIHHTSSTIQGKFQTDLETSLDSIFARIKYAVRNPIQIGTITIPKASTSTIGTNAPESLEIGSNSVGLNTRMPGSGSSPLVPSEMAKSMLTRAKDGIRTSYKNLMDEFLQINNRLNISEEIFQESHSQAKSQAKEEYSKFLSLFNEANSADIESTIEDELQQIQNYTKEHNEKYSTLAKETRRKFQLDFVTAANVWLSEWTDLATPTSSKKSGSTLFDEVMQNTVDNANVPEALKEDFFNLIMHSNAQGWKRMMTNAQDCLDTYRTSMERKFEICSCMGEAKFEEFHDQTFKICIGKVGFRLESLLKFVKKGVEKLKSQFKVRNESTRKLETDSAQRVLPLTKQLYNYTMKNFIQGKRLSSQKLESFHKLAVKKCLTYTKELKKTHPSAEIPNFSQTLINHLRTEFSNYEMANNSQSQLEQGPRQISSISRPKTWLAHRSAQLRKKASSIIGSNCGTCLSTMSKKSKNSSRVTLMQLKKAKENRMRSPYWVLEYVKPSKGQAQFWKCGEKMRKYGIACRYFFFYKDDKEMVHVEFHRPSYKMTLFYIIKLINNHYPLESLKKDFLHKKSFRAKDLCFLSTGMTNRCGKKVFDFVGAEWVGYRPRYLPYRGNKNDGEMDDGKSIISAITQQEQNLKNAIAIN